MRESRHGGRMTAINYRALDDCDLAAFPIILNFAFDWRVIEQPDDTSCDLDRRLAERVARLQPIPRFYFMSTRMVYARRDDDDPEPCRENDPTPGATPYGRVKRQAEVLYHELLGEAATMLRLPNVFGLELGRRTFMGVAQRSLVESDRITLGMNPATPKDFLPLPDFATMLDCVLDDWEINLPVLNISRGKAVEVGALTDALVNGYGSGEVVCSENGFNDAFVLDASLLQLRYRPPPPTITPISYARSLGGLLRSVTPGP